MPTQMTLIKIHEANFTVDLWPLPMEHPGNIDRNKKVTHLRTSNVIYLISLLNTFFLVALEEKLHCPFSVYRNWKTS